MFLECFFDVFPMFFLFFLREKIQKTHEKTLEKHWKNITIFLFFYSLCVFNVFEKNVYFSNVFPMFYFLKTLEKHWKNKVFFIKNIEKTLIKHWKNMGQKN